MESNPIAKALVVSTSTLSFKSTSGSDNVVQSMSVMYDSKCKWSCGLRAVRDYASVGGFDTNAVIDPTMLVCWSTSKQLPCTRLVTRPESVRSTVATLRRESCSLTACAAKVPDHSPVDSSDGRAAVRKSTCDCTNDNIVDAHRWIDAVDR